jgi:hypothetical protein
VLAAVGLAWILPAGWKGCALGAALVVASWLPIRGDSPVTFDTRIAGRALGVIAGKPELQAYVESELARHQRLFAHRSLSTNGLERVAADGLLDAIAREAGPDERVAWIGTLTELSPGALHLGLLARGGSRERFLRDVAATIDLDYFADPRADAAAVRAFAERFDVVFATDPPDLKGRPERAWARAAREGLVADGSWTQRELGRFEIARPLRDPLVVTLFACRRRK